MQRKSAETKSRKNLPPEENLLEDDAVNDLLVSEQDLAKHTKDADATVTHEDVRDALSKVEGSLVPSIRKERDQG